MFLIRGLLTIVHAINNSPKHQLRQDLHSYNTSNCKPISNYTFLTADKMTTL